jgi:signal transduction histidine kinase/ligand-binding sensor domain-containing protein
VFALNPALDVNQYAHTAWTVRGGFAKGTISSIAQTPDGYLWLGTDLGLFRFDGVRTVGWEPPAGQRLPSSDIYNLLAARDGSLWIGTAKGLARWKDGTLTPFTELSGHYVYALLEDREGSIWAGTIALGDAKLCAIERSSRVECYGGGGRFGNAIVGLHQDRSGAIWLGVVDGLWRWTPGPPEFHSMPGERDNIQAFVDDGNALLMTATRGIRRLSGGKTQRYALPGVAREFRPQRLLRDRDGGLWIGTLGRGLMHMHHGRTDVYTITHGLSGDAVNGLFEDREGSIWVATVTGLDRFRDVAVPNFGPNQGVSNATASSVLAASDGSIWFGANRVLNRWNTSSLTRIPSDMRLTGNATAPNSLFQDRRGRLWVSTADGIGYFENERYTPQRGIPGGSTVHAVAEDADGNLWIASQNDGLFRVSRDDTTRLFSWARLGQKDFATALAANPARGGMWVGFQSGGLVHFHDGQVRASYTVADRLGEGRINTLRFDRTGALWATTEGGLSRLNNGRMATLTSSNGLPCNSVHWAIEDDAQSIWLYMTCGLVRIPLSDLSAWADRVDKDDDRTGLIRTTVFDNSDGVTTRSTAGGYSPQAAKSVDGKIWFVSTDGISVVDPGRVPFNSLPPPVYVETITADRNVHDARSFGGGVLRLPALTRDLQIDYTALSLVAPEKMQFRYRLDGRDDDWQDAGNRRQAFYNDLAPGSYRFRVIAANNSGVWNETGATVDFAIAPAYYQTAWFLTLSAAMVLALVWTAHRIRVRIVEKHEREISALNERLMKAQEQERIRIAGELHDGVMQEMLAVTMMLGTAKRRIPNESEARATIDKIQEKMIRVGTDIRQMSHDLHPPALQEAGLPQAVRTYCDEFSESAGIPVACEADDSVRELSRGAGLALFRIVQEALGNAAKHAQARQMTVRLTRSADVVSLTVSDDGRGFDSSSLATPSGMGLITMRERASQLNGKFEFESAPGRGTTISVVIPFR